MASLTGRPNTALIVVDVQNDVVANAHRRDEVVATINGLVTKARAENVPVFWVQHFDDELPKGTEGWEYVPELQREESEPLIHKSYRDSFEDTIFEAELAARGIGKLVLTGAQSDYCVKSTLHGALARGYDTVLVADAHTTDDPGDEGLPTAAQIVAHANHHFQGQSAVGCGNEVLSSQDVSFSPHAQISAG